MQHVVTRTLEKHGGELARESKTTVAETITHMFSNKQLLTLVITIENMKILSQGHNTNKTKELSKNIH